MYQESLLFGWEPNPFFKGGGILKKRAHERKFLGEGSLYHTYGTTTEKRRQWKATKEYAKGRNLFA